jgi:hypothetical protein
VEVLSDFVQVPDEIIKRKVLRSGDGSHGYVKFDNSKRFRETFWGFGENNKGEEIEKIYEFCSQATRK